MKRAFIRCLVGAALSLATLCVQAQTLRASFTSTANFAYQLDCVAQIQRSCAGYADYVKLWRETLKIDPATSPEIKRWVALREKHAQMTEPKNEGDGWPYDQIHMPHRVLTAGLGARDLADYQSRLALVLPDVNVPEAHAVVCALYPAFEQWWNTTAIAQGNARAESFKQAMASEKVVAEARNIFTLLGSPPAAITTATVHLMFRPGALDADHTSGQNMGIESFAEFLAKDTEADELAVILHEYAHFVFASIPKEKGLKLKADIARAGGNAGLTLWGLLNEAQASATGNGRVARAFMAPARYEKYLAMDGTFYANPLIDGAGKALLPLIDEMVAKNESIFDAAFPVRYVEAARLRLGEKLLQPRAILSEFKLLFDPTFGVNWSNEVPRITGASSMWSETLPCCDATFEKQLQSWQASVRVVVIPLRKVEKLSNLSSAQRDAMITARTDARSVTAVSMSETAAPLIVIAADDAAGATAALEMLMKENSLASKVLRVPKLR